MAAASRASKPRRSTACGRGSGAVDGGSGELPGLPPCSRRSALHAGRATSCLPLPRRCRGACRAGGVRVSRPPAARLLAACCIMLNIHCKLRWLRRSGRWRPRPATEAQRGRRSGGLGVARCVAICALQRLQQCLIGSHSPISSREAQQTAMGPSMSDAPDLYAALGVARGATDIEVRGRSSGDAGQGRQQPTAGAPARLPPTAAAVPPAPKPLCSPVTLQHYLGVLVKLVRFTLLPL